MTPVDYVPLATREGRQAERFYARQGGATVAARFRAAVLDAESRVSANPAAWSPDQHGTRACRLKKFPYRLIYVEEPTRVLVLALAHDRRRPGYWVRRLPP